MSLRSLIKTGDYVGADFCYHEIPEKLEQLERRKEAVIIRPEKALEIGRLER